jgi:hypothetical protein
MMFFVVLILIAQQLVFGVIVDTFGELRAEKQERERVQNNTCFICGLERDLYVRQFAQIIHVYVQIRKSTDHFQATLSRRTQFVELFEFHRVATN